VVFPRRLSAGPNPTGSYFDEGAPYYVHQMTSLSDIWKVSDPSKASGSQFLYQSQAMVAFANTPNNNLHVYGEAETGRFYLPSATCNTSTTSTKTSRPNREGEETANHFFSTHFEIFSVFRRFNPLHRSARLTAPTTPTCQVICSYKPYFYS